MHLLFHLILKRATNKSDSPFSNFFSSRHPYFSLFNTWTEREDLRYVKTRANTKYGLLECHQARAKGTSSRFWECWMCSLTEMNSAKRTRRFSDMLALYNMPSTNSVPSTFSRRRLSIKSTRCNSAGPLCCCLIQIIGSMTLSR